MERRHSQPSWADIMEMEDMYSFDEENKKLKAELQEAKDEIRRKENKISFLQRNLSALEENYYTAIKKEREKAKHELKKKEEEIFSVRKRLHTQSKETERVRASLDEWKKSTELKSVEEKWQRKVRQLEELLLEKDKLVSRADDKRRARAKAYIDTLAQLGVTQSALKQSRQTCEALEQKIQSHLAERNVSHQKKLLEQDKGFKKELEEKEKSFQKEKEEKQKTFQKELSQAKQSFEKKLSDSQLQSTKELFLLSETWERRAQQWKQEKRDLEKMLLVKENILKHKEAEGVKASHDEWKKSTELNSVEEKWQRKVSQLEELLLEKDKLVSRADDKRRARAKAHIDTLAQLGVTQSALKQSRQTCEALEQKIQNQMAKMNVSHQKKLLEQDKGFKKELEGKERHFQRELEAKERNFQRELEEKERSFQKEMEEKQKTFQKELSQAKQSFKKELSDSQLQSTKELFLLSETWERRAQQWKQEKRDLEKMLLVKENILKHKEAEGVKASHDEWKKSTELNSVEEKWQRKVSQLEELLLEKDKLVSRADDKRRARAKAHIDTLAQLGVTQSALKQSRQTCEALEQKIQSHLAERNVSHQKKLLEQDKGFKKELEGKERSFQKELSQAKQSFEKELSDSQLQSTKELFLLSETWERRAQQWKQEKRDLEEMLLVKENIWNSKEAERKKELQHLTKITFQLQQLTKAKAEKKQKMNLWSCRLQKWNSSKGSFSATCPFQDDSPSSTHPTLYPNP